MTTTTTTKSRSRSGRARGRATPKPNVGEPAVLFVNIGWAERYEGDESIRGNHRFLSANPNDNSELWAFAERDDGRVRCGAGRGSINVPQVDIVFVARPPGEKGHRIVGVYFDARWEEFAEEDGWVMAETADYLRLDVGDRPNIEWPGHMGMRRWAWRGGGGGTEHEHLYRAYRDLLARHDRQPGGYGWDPDVAVDEEGTDETRVEAALGLGPDEEIGKGREVVDRVDAPLPSFARVIAADPGAEDLVAYEPGVLLPEVLRGLFARRDLRRVSIASFCSNLEFVELTGLARLVSRAKSKVELRFLLPAPYGATEELAVWLRTQHQAGKLEAYEFPDLGHRVMHVKAVLAEMADGRRLAILGSANATAAALASNEEFCVAFSPDARHGESDPFQWFESRWARALEVGCELRPQHFITETMEVRRRVLFDFQLDAQHQMSRHLRPLLEESPCRGRDGAPGGHGGGLIVLPTGAGKTITAMRWIFDHVLPNPDLGRVLWLSHRVELLQQAFDAAQHEELFVRGRKPEVVAVLDGEQRRRTDLLRDGDLVFVSSQRAYEAVRRLPARSVPEFGLIVVDEAHRASMSTKQYGTLLSSVPHRARLGLTATPYRGTFSDARGFADVFTLPEHAGRGRPSAFVSYTVEQIEQMVLPGGAKLMARQHVHHVKTGFRLKVEARNEVQFSKYLREFHDEERNEVVVSTYLDQFQHAGPAILFCVSVDHANALATRINALGGRAQAFHEGEIPREATTLRLRGQGMTRPERGLALRRFAERDIDVLCCVQLLTEGFDLPAIATVLLARPTMSTLLLTQMIGRGLRGPAVGGSESCNIVDFSDQLTIHTKRDAAHRLRVAHPADADRLRRGETLQDDGLRADE